jgi:hypothetical protein
MRTIAKILIVILLLFTATLHAKTITVDGNIADWADVPILVTDPTGDMVDSACGFNTDHRDIHSIKMTSDGQNVYYLIELGRYCSPYNGLAVFFDTGPLVGCYYLPGGLNLILALDPAFAVLETIDSTCSQTNVLADLMTHTVWNNSNPTTTYIEGSIPLSFFTKTTFAIQTSPDSLIPPPTVTLGATTAPPPSYSLSPLYWDFGPVAVGTSATKSFTLQSTGAAGLAVTAAQILGPGAASFSVTANTCLVAVPAAGCTFNVVFAPSAAMTSQASISISSNATTQPTGFALSGTGSSKGIAKQGAPQKMTYPFTASAPDVPLLPKLSLSAGAVESALGDMAREELTNVASGKYDGNPCFISALEAFGIGANNAYYGLGLVDTADYVYNAAVAFVPGGTLIDQLLLNTIEGLAVATLKSNIGPGLPSTLLSDGALTAQYMLRGIVAARLGQPLADATLTALTSSFDNWESAKIESLFNQEGLTTTGYSNTISLKTPPPYSADARRAATVKASIIYDPWSNYATAFISNVCRSTDTKQIVENVVYEVVVKLRAGPFSRAAVPIFDSFRLLNTRLNQ